MSNEKEKVFFVMSLLGSLLHKAAQHAPEERILKIGAFPGWSEAERKLLTHSRSFSAGYDPLPQHALLFYRAAACQLRANSGKKCNRPGACNRRSAIDDLLERVCFGTDSRYKDCLLFNPEDEKRSFGINLLRCENIESLNARQNTYTRAKGVFDKIWKGAYYEVPWLQEVLQYTLYAFIENQDYTLGDAPRFLTDREFREHIVANIRYNRQAADFWRRRFEPKRAAAALTRLDTLLGDPYVHDIVAQTETTLDFTKFMKERRIVLIKLSDKLSTDVKTFIGTILISELVGAVKKRSTENPDHFCIYVDEFQNFASYEDFSTLITGGRKHGVATTVAHQERYGQFGEDRRILGVTDAAGNKLFFQPSAEDAKESAVVFSDAPPMETRREEELVITPYPVESLELLGFFRGENLRPAAVSSTGACSCEAGLCTLPDDVALKFSQRSKDVKDQLPA